MKAKDLRAQEPAALKKELDSLLKAQFSMRMQLGTQQLNNTNQLRNTRRDIARVRTVMTQKAAAK